MHCLLALVACAQAQVAPLWIDTRDLNGQEDQVAALEVDDQGYVYTYASMDVSASGGEAMLRKLGPSGNLVWERVFETPSLAQGSQARDLLLTPSGDLVLLGDAAGGDAPYFVVSYDTNGQLLWSYVVDPGPVDFVLGGDLGVDDVGNVYGTALVAPAGVNSVYTRLWCLNSSGLVQWVQSHDHEPFVAMTGLHVEPGGTVYTYGSQVDALGERRAAVRATSSQGIQHWERTHGDASSGSSDYYWDLDVGSDGHPVLAGTFGLNASSLGESYAVVRKLSLFSGTTIWQRNWTGSMGAGASGSRLKLLPDDSAVLAGSNQSFGGPRTGLLRRYSASGTYLDSFNLTSPFGGDLFFKEILVKDDQEFYVAGQAEDALGNKSSVTLAHNLVTGTSWTLYRGGQAGVVSVQPYLEHAPDGDVYQTCTLQGGPGQGQDVETIRIGDGPMYYCSTQQSSAGCWPVMQSSGVPSISQGSGFQLQAYALRPNQFALFIYSRAGAQAAPFGGGTLCIGAPIVRMPLQVSSTNPGDPCGGTLSLDFNTWLAGGNDPAVSAGTQVWAQCWSRDPGSPSGSNLTGALTFVVQL